MGGPCYGFKILIVIFRPVAMTVAIMVSTTKSVCFILIFTLQKLYCNAGMYKIAM